MKEGAFMKINGPDIAGSCNYEGHEGEIEVLELEHVIDRQVDPDDITRPTSERMHGLVRVRKMVDKSTPLLFKAMCQGQTIEHIQISWHKQPQEGSTEDDTAFVQAFNFCLIAGVRQRMAGGTGGPGGFAWEEVIDIAYRQGVWDKEPEGIMFQDDVRK